MNDTRQTGADALREYLARLPSGPIDNPGNLVPLLAESWPLFTGSDAEAMAPRKLARMERVRWDPPVLEFVVERHGGTARGSSRAALQRWSVDLERTTASCATVGGRQLRPMQPALKVEPIADELVRLVIDGRQDPRLRWWPDGTVRVCVAKILPTGSAAKETLAGRRKRLRVALVERLETDGWSLVKPPETFGRTSAPTP
jgi:hypothetical protein